MALAVVERNALLEQVWERLTARDYAGIIGLLAELPKEEFLSEPELGVILCASWYQVGEMEHALRLVRQLTDVCERRGNTWLSRRRLNCEGLILFARGELEAAEALLQQTLARAEAAHDLQMVSWAHNNLGAIYTGRGAWDFAMSHYRRAIATGQRLGEGRHVALCHLNMGICFERTGRLAEAREFCDRAADLARDGGSEMELAYIDWSRASILEASGDLLLAKVRADQARERFARQNNMIGIAGILDIYGRISLKQGQLGEARRLLDEALVTARAAGHREGEAFVMISLADLSDTEGNPAAAAACLEQAIAIFRAMGSDYQAERLQHRLSMYPAEG